MLYLLLLLLLLVANNQWDVIAAAYITNPDLFPDKNAKCSKIEYSFFGMKDNSVDAALGCPVSNGGGNSDQDKAVYFRGTSRVPMQIKGDEFLDLMVARLCKAGHYHAKPAAEVENKLGKGNEEL